MDFLGIGPLELVFIFIIVLIVLGPRDMVKTGQVIGRGLRRLMTSPTWRLIQDTSREIRHLPNRLARQAGLDDLEQNMREAMNAEDIKDLKEQFGRDLNFEAWTQPTIGRPPDSPNDLPAGEPSQPDGSEDLPVEEPLRSDAQAAAPPDGSETGRPEAEEPNPDREKPSGAEESKPAS